MPAGRPTKQTPEIIEAAKSYLENYEAAGNVFPSVAGLAVAIKVNRSTLYAWSREEGSEFSHILADILDKQECVLWDKGMTGEFNSALTKLALGKHGYSDKNEITGNEGGPVETKWSVEFVNATPKS